MGAHYFQQEDAPHFIIMPLHGASSLVISEEPREQVRDDGYGRRAAHQLILDERVSDATRATSCCFGRRAPASKCASAQSEVFFSFLYYYFYAAVAISHDELRLMHATELRVDYAAARH